MVDRDRGAMMLNRAMPLQVKSDVAPDHVYQTKEEIYAAMRARGIPIELLAMLRPQLEYLKEDIEAIDATPPKDSGSETKD
jgi:hypothetical protein